MNKSPWAQCTMVLIIMHSDWMCVDLSGLAITLHLIRGIAFFAC